MSSSIYELVSKTVEALSALLETHHGGSKAKGMKGSAEKEKPSGFIEMSCQNCGASLQIDLDRIQAYCPYCGNRLTIDIANLDTIIAEREKTKRKQLKYEQERYELELEEKKRPGKIKATVLLAIIGGALMIGGSFAGEATGNSDSSWYLVSMLGFFPLISIAFVWLSGKGNQ